MIGIVEVEGRFCPLAFCDYCGEEIKVATEGNYHWAMGPDDTGPQPAFFTHKECCDHFEGDGEWGAEALERLPWYFAKDMGLDPRRDPDAMPRRGRAGHVYILKSDYGYKIGRSRVIASRLHIFGVKLPFKWDLVWSAKVRDMVAAERRLHVRFAKLRLEGEWFQLTPRDIAALKREAKKGRL